MSQAGLLLRVPVVAKTIGLTSSGSKPVQLNEDKTTASHSFLHSVVSLDNERLAFIDKATSIL